MPDVTLTPVGGDPWNGGAVPLDPASAPPITVSVPDAPAAALGAAPQPDPAPYTAADPPNADGLALQRQGAALGTSLASGHAAGDLRGLIIAAYPDGPGALRSAALTPAMLGAQAVDSVADAARFAGGGWSGLDARDPGSVAAAVPHVVNAVGLMGAGGLPMAEDGAAGAMGGRLAAQAAGNDPLAAMMAALDAHAAANPVEAAAAHPRALSADQLVQEAPDGHFLAFHGSPALFDRFSLDHLGSGEGVQAQGHGAYFASDQNVGAHYADTYGRPRTLPDGSTVNGHMYQVAIPGRPEDYFDQGRNLAEQSPAVRAAAAPLYDAAGIAPDARGGNLVHEMKQNALAQGVPFRDADGFVSRQFQDAGIPGHSYAGDGGQPNFVVFDPSGVKVMKTYAGSLPTFAQPGTPAPVAPEAAPTIPPEVFARLLSEGKAL